MGSEAPVAYTLMSEPPNPNAYQGQFLNHLPNENLPVSSKSRIYSDIALNYIDHVLNDDDDDDVDKFEDSFHGYSALEAAEKPFYEILGQKYPYPSPDSSHSSDSFSPNSGATSSGSSSCEIVGNCCWPYEYSNHQLPIEFDNKTSFAGARALGESGGCPGISSFLCENMPAWNFYKGVEEARKFLPGESKLVIDLEAEGDSATLGQGGGSKVVEVKAENEERGEGFGSRGRKNRHDGDSSSGEGRSVKQSAVSIEDELRSPMLDEVLLWHCETVPDSIKEIREGLRHTTISKSPQSGRGKGANGGKGRGKKKQPPKKDLVDLNTLLIHCSQSVAASDQRTTNELLKQIRQHSPPDGDASQRLAHYFANGLEARLAGTGSELYNSYGAQHKKAAEFLKACQLSFATCPFRKVSQYFSNETILNVSEKAKRVHVVDFGISFGFQWPSLIQRMAARPGGPPMLRITGIDVPLQGLRPARQIEETGRRLADYAQDFGVPFEYKCIASKWEEVCIEDLGIKRDEVLVVNCLYQLKGVADESVAVDSPRNKVLNTIRKMNPNVFIHAVVNGSYGAPFFVTRFREALYHFSALFDMLDTIVPREDEQRLLLEGEKFGREALNVIACEGTERVERPETYKQWQVRNQRAGFVQHPLNEDMMKLVRDKVKAFYHKDFNVDQDGQWLLQGWKGRIVFALSLWKPSVSSHFY